MNKISLGLPSKKKESELIKIIVKSKNGEGAIAKKALLHMCDFVVASVVSKYANAEVSANKLMRSGKKGAEKALNLFILNKRYRKNFRFFTYSIYFIRKAILDELKILR